MIQGSKKKILLPYAGIVRIKFKGMFSALRGTPSMKVIVSDL